MIITSASLSLEVFLTEPETKPRREYIEGKVQQKPMPKTRHSRLQSKLSTLINAVAEPPKIAYAFPELRCTFGNRSLVPDIAVLRWSNIPFNRQGEPLDDIVTAPDWHIEILSPGQSANKVSSNILHSLRFGAELAWLIDPDDRSVLVFQPKQEPLFCAGNDRILTLKNIDLPICGEDIFSWLKM